MKLYVLVHLKNYTRLIVPINPNFGQFFKAVINIAEIT